MNLRTRIVFSGVMGVMIAGGVHRRLGDSGEVFRGIVCSAIAIVASIALLYLLPRGVRRAPPGGA